MTLLEIAIITGTSFNETYVSTKANPEWLFSLHGIEIKDGRNLLISAYGRGKTLAMAKKDYAKQLQSKTIFEKNPQAFYKNLVRLDKIREEKK